ncbi:uncharacterized protein [Macrobrachium rosenbergii]|uniref:uncharacterized protein n=1 Tax=Macrobrachium rosenbergii TaxID=79674 RepID=UPI0034D3BEF2
MNLPLMRRGLSPEGRKIRERHQGSLTIGIQGITVHPAERSQSRRDFMQDNVKRLREIQARCKERDNSKRSQPLKATRDSSASTNSSVQQAESLVPLRNGSAKLGRRSRSSDREGSAHSDYFSLAEEHIEPLNLGRIEDNTFEQDDSDQIVTSNRPTSSIVNNNEVKNSGNLESARHLSRSASSLSPTDVPLPHFSPLPSQQKQMMGSPRRLKPLAHKNIQTVVSTQSPPLRQDLVNRGVLHSDLSQEMRKLRMDSLMSRIKSQKPACEIDYNTHYKSIENQHRMLLDSSDMLSLYGSGDGGVHNDSDTHRSAKNNNSGNSRMARTRSFDKDLASKKSVSGTNKSKRLHSAADKNNLKKVNLPSSPLIKKKLSQSIGNLGCNSTNSSVLKSAGCEQITNRTLKENWKTGLEGQGKVQENDRPRTDRFERSRSNLERVKHYSGDSYVQETARSEEEVECNDFGNTSFRAPSPGDTNLDATVLSSCDLNFPEHDQSYDVRPEELQLNVLSESQSDLNNIDNQRREEIRESVRERRQLKEDYDITETIDNKFDESPSHVPEKTSTPVPNIKCRPHTPKLKRRESPETHRSTLRRSQSMKNVKHQPWDVPLSYQRGKLPRYLLARKAKPKIQNRQQKSGQTDPECPPGHAPLSEYEPNIQIHLPEKSQAEVMRELSTLPVAQDTLRVKKKRHDLEEKLMQIEDGLRIFSQPKVYVVNDD